MQYFGVFLYFLAANPLLFRKSSVPVKTAMGYIVLKHIGMVFSLMTVFSFENEQAIKNQYFRKNKKNM
jgi:hypothetical protein